MANQSRRKFIRTSLFSIAALPLGASLLSQRAFAEGLLPLETSSPLAQALKYVKVAEEASANPSYKEGSNCANCMFFQAANNGCQLFPQNSVESAGWCQSWVQKP